MIWIDFDVQHPVSKHDSKANITPLQALKNKTTKILCLTDYSLLQVLPGDALRVQYSRDEFRSSVMGVEPQFHPKAIIIILRRATAENCLIKKILFSSVKLINSTVQFSFGPDPQKMALQLKMLLKMKP